MMILSIRKKIWYPLILFLDSSFHKGKEDHEAKDLEDRFRRASELKQGHYAVIPEPKPDERHKNYREEEG